MMNARYIRPLLFIVVLLDIDAVIDNDLDLDY